VGDRAVLIVEDNEVNSLLARLILEQCGLRAIVASDGDAALRQLDGTPGIAVVLMDLHLPGMDGFEITRCIRARPALEDLPVIACTADVLTEDLDSSLAAGMNCYVCKPIDRGAMVEALVTSLRQVREPASAA
jgi:CheY-like chemotaxis protein